MALRGKKPKKTLEFITNNTKCRTLKLAKVYKRIEKLL